GFRAGRGGDRGGCRPQPAGRAGSVGVAEIGAGSRPDARGAGGVGRQGRGRRGGRAGRRGAGVAPGGAGASAPWARGRGPGRAPGRYRRGVRGAPCRGCRGPGNRACRIGGWRPDPGAGFVPYRGRGARSAAGRALRSRPGAERIIAGPPPLTMPMDPRLKQRLIGAAVLVALAVIFLPMLVKGPAPDSGVSDLSLDLPDRPADAGTVTRDLPLVAPRP